MLRRFRQGLWSVLLRTWQAWQKSEGLLLSAAMAYSAALSLFPLCLVVIAALGVVMRLSTHAQNEQKELLELVAKTTSSPWLSDQLGHLLAGVKANAGFGGPIGLLTLLIAVTSVFAQLDFAFNRIWGTGRTASGWLSALRQLLHDRAMAFLILLVVAGLVLALFLSDIVLARILDWRRVQISLSIVSNTVLFGVLYKVVPRARVKWWAALVGGLLVAIVWLIGQRLLVALVLSTSYSAYGIVGSFIAVMLWLYYASAITFLGAALVRALHDDAELNRPRT
ncbi:MAG: YihY/virulence factor BrkB family protein [Thermoguttaceae bacterium]|jgi:membrane protein